MTTSLKATLKKDDIVKLPSGIRATVLDIARYQRDTYVTFLQEDGKRQTMNLKTDGAWAELKKARTGKKIIALFERFASSEKIRQLVRLNYCKHGSDPEIFVVNSKTKEVIPSFAFLKSKEEPNRIEAERGVVYGNNNPLFWDGFQAEFNTSAEECLAWVCDSTYNGLMTLAKIARAHNKDAKLTIKSTIDVPIEMLMEAKNEHVEFGCMPSLNAYGHSGLKVSGRNVPFRSAGGHIHFGVKDYLNTKDKAEQYVKALDKILGVACVALFAGYDDPRRRELYGLAGEYRLPPHGLEYRTLSNAWLTHPLIMNMVFELGRRVVALSEGKLMQGWDATEEETIDCINNCDVKLAQKILKRNKILFKNILYSIIRDDEKASVMYKIYFNGMDTIIDNTDDVEGNWKKGYTSHCEGTGHTIGKMGYLGKYAKVKEMKEE